MNLSKFLVLSFVFLSLSAFAQSDTDLLAQNAGTYNGSADGGHCSIKIDPSPTFAVSVEVPGRSTTANESFGVVNEGKTIRLTHRIITKPSVFGCWFGNSNCNKTEETVVLRLDSRTKKIVSFNLKYDAGYGTDDSSGLNVICASLVKIK